MGDYSVDENIVWTLCPDDPATQLISVTFNEFDAEDGWDGMQVYDGNSTAAPVLPGPDDIPAGRTCAAVDAGYSFVDVPAPDPPFTVTASASDGMFDV